MAFSFDSYFYNEWLDFNTKGTHLICIWSYGLETVGNGVRKQKVIGQQEEKQGPI